MLWLRLLMPIGMLASVATATPYPYSRTYTNGTMPEKELPQNIADNFISWLLDCIQNHQVADASGELSKAFLNVNPDSVQSTEDLEKFVASRQVPPDELPGTIWDKVGDPANISDAAEAQALF